MQEKINKPILSLRAKQLQLWLQQTAGEGKLSPLAGDAGSRQYYRWVGGGQRHIVVDDPSPTQRRKFLTIGKFLAQASIAVPAVGAVDKKNGFLLLEDFGDDTYWHHLPHDADSLYTAALRTLVKIQQRPPAFLPPYSKTLLQREIALFGNWYCARHLNQPLRQAEKRTVARAAEFLIAAMCAQPQVVVHRDYHARNLLVRANAPSPGVLDFQDAVCGALTYDLVSLLRDAYVDWPSTTQKKWLTRYWQFARAAGIPNFPNRADLWTAFNISGAQRGLKVLGIFARLTHRDHKRQFVQDMPLAHRHLLSACAEIPELHDLGDLVATRPPCGR